MEVSNCRLPLTILVRQPHRLKKAGGVCGRSAARFFVARIDGSCASVRLDATRQSSVMWWRTRCCEGVMCSRIHTKKRFYYVVLECVVDIRAYVVEGVGHRRTM